MRHCRVDANQKEIVTALRRAGASVFSLAALGKGCPDLLVADEGVLYLLEIKNPKTGYGRKGLAPSQAKWSADWPVQVVHSAAEALMAVRGGRRGAAA